MDSTAVRWPALAVFSAALAAAAAYLTVECVALAADGAWFLLQIVAQDAAYGLPSRSFVIWARQAPVLLGLKAGTTDLHLLAVLLGVGQLMLSAVVWAGSVLLARRDAFACCVVILTASICWSTTALFSVGELALAIPLAVLLAVLLWSPEPWTAWRAVLSVGVAMMLTRSHEAIFLIAVLLSIWAILRARRAVRVLERAACGLVGLLGVATVVGAIPEIHRRRDDPSAENLAGMAAHLQPLEVYTLLVLALCLLALLFVALPPLVRLGLIALGALGAVSSAFGLFATTGDAYSGRGGAMVVAFVAVLALFALWSRPRPAARGVVSPGAAVWACVAVAIAPLFAAGLRAEQYADGLASFRSVVDSRQGLVPHSELTGDRFVLRNGTAPTLSLLVRRSPDGAIVLDPPGIWQPFPPEQARAQLDDRFTWR